MPTGCYQYHGEGTSMKQFQQFSRDWSSASWQIVDRWLSTNDLCLECRRVLEELVWQRGKEAIF